LAHDFFQAQEQLPPIKHIELIRAAFFEHIG